MNDPTQGVSPASDEVVEALPVEQEPAPDPHTLGIDLPEGRDEAVALLLTELGTARDEAGAYLDDLRRVAADFDNYRKRVMKESATSFDRAAERVVKTLMPVLDSFDAALGTEPGTDTERLLYSGILNTREQMLKALEAEGLEVIPTVGEPFDPEVHEPVGAPEGSGRLVVADELRRGYRIKDKVLRAALVRLESEE
jgi:molecular chaperone GrpE